MKKTLLPLLCFLLANSAKSATVCYWDPEGTNTPTAANLTGTWDGITTQWNTVYTQTATPVAWVPGYAVCFCAGTTTMTTPFTVTLNSTLDIGGIFNGGLTPPGFFVTITGSGSLNLSPTYSGGVAAFDTSGSDNGTTTINVPMSGPDQIALEGRGQTYFNATNSYTGGTAIGYPGVAAFTGILNFNNPYAFGTGSLIMNPNGNNGTLTYKGSTPATITNTMIATNANLNIVGIPGGLTFSGPWTLGATPAIGATNLIFISGAMSGAGGFCKYGSGTLVLGGANSYTGNTTVSNGVLSITADNNLGTPPSTATPSIFLPGGTLNASNTFTLNPNRLIYLTANSTLGVSSGKALTYGGNINGANTLTKNGAGTLVLTNASSGYSGATTISSGTLEADSQSSVGTLGTNTLSVSSGAALSGNGVLSGPVTVMGNITPGTASGPGTLTLGNGLTMSAGGTYVWNLAQNSTIGSFSTISLVGGNLNLGGSSKLSLNFTGSASAPSASNPFWQTQEAWTIATVSTPGGNTNSTKFTSIVNGNYTAGSFSNYVYPGGNIVLLYQPKFPVFDALYDDRAGFGGENLILTNFSGLNLSVWSTTNASLAVSNWTFVDTLFEQPQGTGYSIYSITVSPTASPTYYIAGNFTSGPYVLSQAPATIVTAPPDFSYFNVLTTNVSMSTNGVLALLPPAPTFLSGGSAYVGSGGFQLQFNAATNENYTIQASTDLISWTNLGSGTALSSPIFFTDPAATNFSKRFYRIVVPVQLP